MWRVAGEEWREDFAVQSSSVCDSLWTAAALASLSVLPIFDVGGRLAVRVGCYKSIPNMKDIVRLILLLWLSLSITGCISMKVVKDSKSTKADSTGKTTTSRNPAYWLLLPLTVPVDIVTSPIQVLVLLTAPHIDG
jgi:hypothetical protein